METKNIHNLHGKRIKVVIQKIQKIIGGKYEITKLSLVTPDKSQEILQDEPVWIAGVYDAATGKPITVKDEDWEKLLVGKEVELWIIATGEGSRLIKDYKEEIIGPPFIGAQVWI